MKEIFRWNFLDDDAGALELALTLVLHRRRIFLPELLKP